MVEISIDKEEGRLELGRTLLQVPQLGSHLSHFTLISSHDNEILED